MQSLVLLIFLFNLQYKNISFFKVGPMWIHEKVKKNQIVQALGFLLLHIIAEQCSLLTYYLDNVLPLM